MEAHAHDVLDHRVREHRLGELPRLVERGLVGRPVDGELEALADAHAGEAALAEARECAGHGLALGVEQFGLGHDVDDDDGHE